MVQEIKLGLCNPPEPIYLYVKNGESGGTPYLWYQYDIAQDKTIPVHHKGLTGYLTELRVTTKEYKGQENHKLDLVINADELYVVRTGIETNFAKTFLLAASLVEDFSKPLIISVVGGEENVVFCRLYDAQTKIKYQREWDANADWFSIIGVIQSKLSGSPQSAMAQEFSIPVVPPPKPVTKPQTSTQSKAPPAVHPHDVRVREVRLLCDYPKDLVKKWVYSHNVEAPAQLPTQKVDELIKTICLGWAANHHFDLDPNYIELSYREQVIDTIASGVPEIQAIQQWMNYVAGLRTPAGVR